MAKKKYKWELKLYVAGKTPKSVAAINNLEKYCETYLQGEYKIELKKSPDVEISFFIIE